MKKLLFVDMDGTVADMFGENQYLERFYEKEFFLNLKPMTSVIEAVKELSNDYDVYILSACVDSKYCIKEKSEWLNKYMNFINKDHIIFSKVGENKAEVIKNITGKEIDNTTYLLDDYSTNLKHWEEAGGIGIKMLNNINGNNGTFKGNRTYAYLHHKDITKQIKNAMN